MIVLTGTNNRGGPALKPGVRGLRPERLRRVISPAGDGLGTVAAALFESAGRVEPFRVGEGQEAVERILRKR